MRLSQCVGVPGGNKGLWLLPGRVVVGAGPNSSIKMERMFLSLCEQVRL